MRIKPYKVKRKASQGYYDCMIIDGIVVIKNSDGYEIARCAEPKLSQEQNLYNGWLLAASNDMLNALTLVRELVAKTEGYEVILKIIDNAFRKVETGSERSPKPTFGKKD